MKIQGKRRLRPPFSFVRMSWLVEAKEAGHAKLAGKSCLLVSLRKLEPIYFAEIAEPA
jgi:hypothetical protein